MVVVVSGIAGGGVFLHMLRGRLPAKSKNISYIPHYHNRKHQTSTARKSHALQLERGWLRVKPRLDGLDL